MYDKYFSKKTSRNVENDCFIYIYVYLKFAIYNLELVDNDSDENSNNKHNNCNNMITIVMLITKLIK